MSLRPFVLGAVAMLASVAPTAAADEPPSPSPATGAPPPAVAPRASAESGPRPVPVSQGAPADWRVGDQLEVRVLGRADLSSSVRVLADGTIDVPFAGRVRVEGRPLDDIRAEVEKGFSRHERTPQVAITVSSLAADEFYVLGEVVKAGVYEVPRTKRVTLLQALGMAGGFNAEADFTRVQVIPARGGTPQIVDASPAKMSGLSSVRVSDGDTIVVPSVGKIYLMGQVNRTGGFSPPAGERMTLTRALALGGGFTRLADTAKILVSWRDPSGQSQTATFNAKAILAGGAEDVPVYPGNLIYVTERLF